METIRRSTQSTSRAFSHIALEHELREWMLAITQRDEAALAKLYDATVNQTWALAMRITHQKEAVEEVVEDCYWQVWRDAHRYDAERGRVLTWLLTICRSRALDYLRCKDVAEPMADIESLCSGELSDQNDPLDILQSTRRASAVHRALLTLNHKSGN